ncbi:MAG: hypothetical protein R3C03_10640 [Pirellulaceae bacterium]
MATHLIGIDEAGYGPNLGPLVVGASMWSVPEETTDLYEHLSDAVSSNSADRDRLTIADSKELYSTSSGLETLERNVLALLATTGRTPSNVRELLNEISSLEFPEAGRLSPQLSLFDSCPAKTVGSSQALNADYLNEPQKQPLPIEAGSSSLGTLRERFETSCAAANIELRRITGACLQPNEFNDLVHGYGNKSTVLTTTSLLLAKRLIADNNDTKPVAVHCDKHGGRSRYGDLLSRIFECDNIAVETESAAFSSYRFMLNEQPVFISFTAKGEKQLETALASMYAKYVREVVMVCWNAFWQERLPGIKSTAGYPTDAKRFWAEIEHEVKKMKLSKNTLWRVR